jgi:hypothetical protein
MRNTARFNERCATMRGKYAIKPDPLLRTNAQRQRLEREQAFIYGFEAGKEAAPAAKRPKNPFTDERLQKAWRRGYAMGKKGLKVKVKLP